MSNINVSIINKMDDFESFRVPWNELLSKSNSDNVFLTWEWLYSWAECFLNKSRELFIVVFHEDNEVIGIAPWYIKSIRKRMFEIRQIDFLGTNEAGSDYLDVIIKKGKEKHVSLFLYNFIFTDATTKWDRLRLYDIPSNSLFLMHFLNITKEKGKYIEVNHASFCPVAMLPASEDEFMSSLSSKRGQSFRRDLKILRKSDIINHVIFSTENIGTAIKDFFNLYAAKSNWPDNNQHMLIQKFIDKTGDGSIQIDFLTADGVPIAGLLHLRYLDTLNLYHMAVDKTYNPKVSLGNIMVGLSIINAIRSGIKCYDFLKGDEEYKFHWTSYGKRASTVCLTNRKIIPGIYSLAHIAKSAAKLALR